MSFEAVVSSSRRMSIGVLALSAALAFTAGAPAHLFAQATPSKVLPVDANASGDQPDNPGPLATDLSADLTPKAIQAAMKKVGDWQLRVAEPSFNRQWTFAALYDGLLAASKTTGDPKYRDAVLKFSESQHWQLIDT